MLVGNRADVFEIDRALASLIGPSVMTPEQYSVGSGQATQTPELRLMLAVLADAIAVYFEHTVRPLPRTRRAFEQASTWLTSGDKSWPFSFENICAALNLEPDYVRRGLFIGARTSAARASCPHAFRRVNGTRHMIKPPREAEPVSTALRRVASGGY